MYNFNASSVELLFKKDFLYLYLLYLQYLFQRRQVAELDIEDSQFPVCPTVDQAGSCERKPLWVYNMVRKISPQYSIFLTCALEIYCTENTSTLVFLHKKFFHVEKCCIKSLRQLGRQWFSSYNVDLCELFLEYKIAEASWNGSLLYQHLMLHY